MRDGSNRTVDFPSRDVRAFDEEFPIDLRLTSVGDVNHGEFGEAVASPHVVFVVPPHRISHRVVVADGPRVHRGNDHQLVAVQHHGHGRAVGERHAGSGFNGTKFWNANDVEVLPLEVVDVIAVGLDEIGLVNTGFLVVGAGEVLALHTRWFGGARLRRAPPFGHGTVIHHHFSVAKPYVTIVVLFSDRLENLNAVLFFYGLLERTLQRLTVFIRKQLGAGHGS